MRYSKPIEALRRRRAFVAKARTAIFTSMMAAAIASVPTGRAYAQFRNPVPFLFFGAGKAIMDQLAHGMRPQRPVYRQHTPLPPRVAKHYPAAPAVRSPPRQTAPVPAHTAEAAAPASTVPVAPRVEYVPATANSAPPSPSLPRPLLPSAGEEPAKPPAAPSSPSSSAPTTAALTPPAATVAPPPSSAAPSAGAPASPQAVAPPAPVVPVTDSGAGKAPPSSPKGPGEGSFF